MSDDGRVLVGDRFGRCMQRGIPTLYAWKMRATTGLATTRKVPPHSRKQVVERKPVFIGAGSNSGLQREGTWAGIC